eukprot:4231717-Pyramimonas_sp.AAC.1
MATAPPVPSLLVYNPLHAAGDRLLDIVAEVPNIHVLCLPGTQRQALVDCPYQVSMAQQRVCIEAGWRAGGFSNRAAGVAAVLPPGWRQQHVRRVELPPPPLQGRVLYYPPRPSTATGLRQYFACCKKLSEWIAGLLRQVPAR